MQTPSRAHFEFVDRNLRYLQGTTNLGLIILSNNTLDLHGFSEMDWVDVQLHASLAQVIAPSLAVIASARVQRNNQHWLYLVHMLNTKQWPPLQLS